MGNKKSKAMTALESMSKEELVDLIKNSGFWFMRDAEQRIKDARGRVARRHADQAFDEYEKLTNQAMDMPKDTIDQLVAWGQKYKEAERFFHKYERLWKRADLLQFGPKKENEHATK